MIERFDHVGVAVRSLARAKPFYTGILGGQVILERTVEPMKLKVCKIRVADAVVELLEGLEGEEVVRKFIDRRGEGLHHLCWAVADLKASAESFAKRGYAPIWDQPRIGAAGKPVHFLHPRDTNGLLLELVQA